MGWALWLLVLTAGHRFVLRAPVFPPGQDSSCGALIGPVDLDLSWGALIGPVGEGPRGDTGFLPGMGAQ